MIVFVRATGRQRSIVISFPIHQIHQIIDALIQKNENDQYFDELLRYKSFSSFSQKV